MPDKKSSPMWTLLLLLLVFAGVVMVSQVRSTPSVRLPAPLPDANVVGWLNTDKPLTADDLAGKWVVVDLWATWCGPCIASMPDLAAFHERWEGKNVVVIGITSDTAAELRQIRNVIDDVPGFDWPVAYGGGEVFDELGVQMIPTLVAYDPTGKLAWKGHHLGGLDELIAGAEVGGER